MNYLKLVDKHNEFKTFLEKYSSESSYVELVDYLEVFKDNCLDNEALGNRYYLFLTGNFIDFELYDFSYGVSDSVFELLTLAMNDYKNGSINSMFI